MKTKIDLGNKVKLTPVFIKDEKSDYYKVHYKGFSRLLVRVRLNRRLS